MSRVIGGLLLGIFVISMVLKPFIVSMLPTLAVWGEDYEVAVWALMPVIMLILLIPLAVYALKKKDKKPTDWR